jgi:aminopeptidase YwaD
MVLPELSQKASTYLHKLCIEIPTRRVGSDGNRAATGWFAQAVAAFGFNVECLPFDCIDWIQGGAHLTAGGVPFAVLASPYTLGVRAHAPLVVASTVDELEAVEATGRILLLRGAIAHEQLMPKNFSFYNPDEHRRIVALLEAKQPQAIVAATGRNPELAGAVYPFPLIEDGDFDIPSVYMTEEEGERLAGFIGREVAVEIRARRIPATGCNVEARKGACASRRVVLFAHIDAKEGTPGATDNATGVATLLLLAELLADYGGRLGIELVAMNGEDYYAAPGENQYVARNAGRWGEILLGVNLDGTGYRHDKTAYSLYNCPAGMEDGIRQAFAPYPELIEGGQWYQSDHSLFVQNGVPALALTSAGLAGLQAQIAHTAEDRPEIVDPASLATAALALRDLLLLLDR